jgi:hypothetical protein
VRAVRGAARVSTTHSDRPGTVLRKFPFLPLCNNLVSMSSSQFICLSPAVPLLLCLSQMSVTPFSDPPPFSPSPPLSHLSLPPGPSLHSSASMWELRVGNYETLSLPPSLSLSVYLSLCRVSVMLLLPPSPSLSFSGVRHGVSAHARRHRFRLAPNTLCNHRSVNRV